MKKINEIKNFKVTMDECSILNSTGEIDEINHEEFFFMTKEKAKRQIALYAETYKLWKLVKEDYNGFEKTHKSPCLTGNVTVSMQEVNLIGIVKYKVVLSEEYDFSECPSTIEVFASIEEAQEYFDNLVEEAKEGRWGRESDYIEIQADNDFAFKAEAPGDKISITLEEFVQQYTPTELWEVRGVDDLEGMTFAVCTSEDKAIEAEKLLKAQGFEDIVIKRSNLNLDEIKIGEDIILL